MPIASTDIKLFRSSNGSLGGAVTSTAIGTNVFDAVTSAEATAGRTEYRCVYVRNDSALALENAVLAVQSDSSSPSTALSVGVGTALMNATEPPISAENVPPADVSFGSSTQLGSIPAGQARSVWLRRAVSPGAAALNPDASNLRVTGGYTEAGEPQTFFDSLSYTDGPSTPWEAQNGRPLVLELHGSSGANTTTGRQYRAQVSGGMAFEGFTEFAFSLIAGSRVVNGSTVYHVNLRPVDRWVYNGTARESMHIGFRKAADGRVYLTSERRYDTLMAWAMQNLTQYDLNKRVAVGGSMGAWGVLTWALRRPEMFAAIYADRPRWRYSTNAGGKITIATLQSGWIEAAANDPTLLADEDGGTSYAQHLDLISYISNPANKIRPLFFCAGSSDGFMPFSDFRDAVDALRATGRAFACAWNAGGHADGSIMNQINQSYPYGTYSLDKGYPVFTEHSLDNNPRVDSIGGINIGLTFRNVVETANGWSCEVTNILAACVVKVSPKSDVFISQVTSKIVTIPAAGEYVSVSFVKP